MSRRDRVRAESGTIFRDGSYVNKEEWYAAHPTRAMKAQQSTVGAPYQCTVCNRRHSKGKIYQQHLEHAEPVILVTGAV